MSQQDIRWHQRLQNYSTALRQLESAVQLAQTKALSDLEKQGMIQAFEFTHELAWNVIKDYFEFQGNSSITGSRDASREAFQKGLTSEGDTWMEMIKSRNQTSHTYNKKIADEIVDKVQNLYFLSFIALETKMKSLIGQN
jgi:nucleotidyltransferase substrate binding protein (TIGR01987 family)